MEVKNMKALFWNKKMHSCSKALILHYNMKYFPAKTENRTL